MADRERNIPVASHEPRTAAELGLHFETPPRSRRRIAIAVVMVVAVAVVAATQLVGGDDGDPQLVALAPGSCLADAPVELPARVSTRACSGPHRAQLVAVFSDPSPDEAPYPGAESLILLGQGTCAAPVESFTGSTLTELVADDVVLQIAVPDRSSWVDDQRRFVACLLVGADGGDLLEDLSAS